jgi:two-component system sensor histidine kinase TctE
MTSDLRNRLLLLLVLPLCVLAWWACGWTTARPTTLRAGTTSACLRLLPALADSVVAPSIHEHGAPLLLLAPPVEDFLRQNAGFAGYSVRDADGQLLLGDEWVDGVVPTTAGSLNSTAWNMAA